MCWITTEKGTATEKPWGSGPNEMKGGGGSSNYTESGKVDRRELKFPSERMDWRKRFAC